MWTTLGLPISMFLKTPIRTMWRLRIPARHYMYPGFTCLAAKAGEQSLERGDNGLKVLFAEVGPLVVMHSFVHGPLLDVRRASSSGYSVLAFPCRLFLGIIAP